MIRIENEDNIERLRQYALIQEREVVALRRRLDALTGRLAEALGTEQQELLKSELEDLGRQLSSSKDEDPLAGKSERRSAQKEAKVRKERTEYGPTDQPDLEVEEVVLELDEADRICPECGGDLVLIEGQFEESELIDRIEVRYLLKRVQQQKYRCTCSSCQHLEAALPSEDRLKEGGRYSIDFAIGIIVDKYLMHLPLERQIKKMGLAGLKVTSQTLWDQLWVAVNYLKPSWEALWKYQLQSTVLGADETRWRLLNKKGFAKPQIITLTSENAVYYAFEHNKTAETIDALLGDFNGWLIVDGINLYPAVRARRLAGYTNGTRAGPPFEIANCWFHARRYFVKAAKDFGQAERMLDLIAMLFRVVEGARDERVLADERRQWVEAILGEMQAWMRTITLVPDSSLAKAIGYLRNYWTGLTRFVDNPEIWLDNNASERALRGPVLGRKNHYGSKSERGMLAAAIFYSLIETCQLIGVDPAEYLREAIRRAKAKPASAFLPHEMLETAPL